MTLIDPEIGFVQVGAESTYGQEASSFTALFPVGTPEVDEQHSKVEQEIQQKPTDAKLPHEMVKDRTSFSVTVQPSPIPFEDGAVPDVGAALQACRLSETLSGTTSSGPVKAVYERTTDLGGSCTWRWARYDRDAQKWLVITLTGWRGNVSVEASSEGFLQMSFEGEALFASWDVPDSAPTPPTTTDYDGGKFLVQNHTFSFGSLKTDVTDFSFDAGMTTNARTSTAGTEMADEIYLTSDGPPNGEFNPPVAESSFGTDGAWEEARSAGEMAWNYKLENANNLFRVQSDQAQIDIPDFNADGRDLRHGITYECVESGPGAGDDFSMEFEASA